MPEKPSERPTTDISWAEDPTPNQITEPVAKRAKGYFEGTAPGSGDADKHPAGYKNWTAREHGRHTTHLEAISPRQFEDFPDMWESTVVPAAGDLVRFVAPAAGRARVAPYWNTTSPATASGSVTEPCTDNERIYYISGSLSTSVIAVTLVGGTLLWEQTSVTSFSSVCCDGAYVYWTRQTIAGLFQRDKSDGLASASGGTTAGADALASNGVYVVGIEGTGAGGAGVVTFWQVSAASVTQTGTASTTSAALNANAVDSDNCYVGGTRSGTTDVWAYDLSTRGSVWASQLSTAAAPTVEAIATDGDVVYVGTTRVATATGFANVFAVERTSGRVMWEIDVGAVVNVIDIAVDDRYLYVVTSGLALFIYRLRIAAPLPPLVAIAPGAWSAAVPDGLSVIGGDGNAPNEDAKRAWIGGPTRLFQRVAADDPNRRPLFTQLNPIDGRF